MKVLFVVLRAVILEMIRHQKIYLAFLPITYSIHGSFRVFVVVVAKVDGCGWRGEEGGGGSLTK